MNAIVLADFSDLVSIHVVKHPDMVGFLNPGLMRVSIEQAIRGGDRDCRNRLVQKMSQLWARLTRHGPAFHVSVEVR